MSVLSRNELLHKYEKEIREIDEINKNNKFKHISELNRNVSSIRMFGAMRGILLSC